MLAAILDPFHRPAELERGGRDDGLLRIEDGLRPEAAADVGRDHADRFEFAAEELGEHAAADMRRLRARPDGQQIAHRIVARHDRAGFHRHAAAAVLPDRLAEDMRGLLKSRVDIAIGERKAGGDVEIEIAVAARRAVLDAVAAVGDGGQHVIADAYGGGRVLGDIAAVGDHDGDRLADIADFVARQGRLGARHGDRRSRQQERHALRPHRLRQIGRRDHRVHAGNRQSLARVDHADAGMRMRRAHEAGMQHAGQPHVVDEAATAGEQGRVFEPAHACAEMFRSHRFSLGSRRAGAGPRRAPP